MTEPQETSQYFAAAPAVTSADRDGARALRHAAVAACAPTAACSATAASTPAPRCCCARARARRRRHVPRPRLRRRRDRARRWPGAHPTSRWSPSTSTSGRGRCAPPTPPTTASATSRCSPRTRRPGAALRRDLVEPADPHRQGGAPRAAAHVARPPDRRRRRPSGGAQAPRLRLAAALAHRAGWPTERLAVGEGLPRARVTRPDADRRVTNRWAETGPYGPFSTHRLVRTRSDAWGSTAMRTRAPFGRCGGDAGRRRGRPTSPPAPGSRPGAPPTVTPATARS